MQFFAPCSQEEADSRMMLQVAHAVTWPQQLLIRPVDTDVVVLAVMVAETLPAADEIWLAFGNGKKVPIFSSPSNHSFSCIRRVACPSYVSSIKFMHLLKFQKISLRGLSY